MRYDSDDMSAPEINSVYGPVRSWRLGSSLGIDLLCVDSICSFECVYCQLGKINRVTVKRDTFVTLEKLRRDIESSEWRSADVVTFSGSGEPTLASNLGEAIDLVREITGKPIIVLTNSTLLGNDSVLNEITRADRIFCKLDAWNDEMLRRIDRPANGIGLEDIINGLVKLRGLFDGLMALQTMLLRCPTETDIESFNNLVRRIQPDEVQLNSPSRPIPPDYFTETRGNEVKSDQSFKTLKVVSKLELETIASRLAELSGIPVTSR
jgi:wyosine [tRNA(Phe)-imidazoG37] synthetase (radical SAM superfamily)